MSRAAGIAVVAMVAVIAMLDVPAVPHAFAQQPVDLVALARSDRLAEGVPDYDPADRLAKGSGRNGRRLVVRHVLVRAGIQ